jgi:hypothetical protein
MIVALGMIGVNASRLNRALHRRFCDIVLIVDNGATKIVEFASDFVNHQVAHGEADSGVRAVHRIRVGAKHNTGKAKREKKRYYRDNAFCVMHAFSSTQNHDGRPNTEASRQRTSSTSGATACKNTDAAMLFACTTLACSSQ